MRKKKRTRENETVVPIGTLYLAQDFDGEWFPGYVQDSRAGEVWIRFEGWGEGDNEWLQVGGPRLELLTNYNRKEKALLVEQFKLDIEEEAQGKRDAAIALEAATLATCEKGPEITEAIVREQCKETETNEVISDTDESTETDKNGSKVEGKAPSVNLSHLTEVVSTNAQGPLSTEAKIRLLRHRYPRKSHHEPVVCCLCQTLDVPIHTPSRYTTAHTNAKVSPYVADVPRVGIINNNDNKQSTDITSTSNSKVACSHSSQNIDAVMDTRAQERGRRHDLKNMSLANVPSEREGTKHKTSDDISSDNGKVGDLFMYVGRSSQQRGRAQHSYSQFVYAHVSCVLFTRGLQFGADGTLLNSRLLIDMENGITRASGNDGMTEKAIETIGSSFCAHCGMNKATIQCSYKKCEVTYHFKCLSHASAIFVDRGPSVNENDRRRVYCHTHAREVCNSKPKYKDARFLRDMKCLLCKSRVDKPRMSKQNSAVIVDMPLVQCFSCGFRAHRSCVQTNSKRTYSDMVDEGCQVTIVPMSPKGNPSTRVDAIVQEEECIETKKNTINIVHKGAEHVTGECQVNVSVEEDVQVDTKIRTDTQRVMTVVNDSTVAVKDSIPYTDDTQEKKTGVSSTSIDDIHRTKHNIYVDEGVGWEGLWRCGDCTQCVECTNLLNNVGSVTDVDCTVCQSSFHKECLSGISLRLYNAFPNAKFVCNDCTRCCECFFDTPGDSESDEWVIGDMGRILCTVCWRSQTEKNPEHLAFNLPVTEDPELFEPTIYMTEVNDSARAPVGATSVKETAVVILDSPDCGLPMSHQLRMETCALCKQPESVGPVDMLVCMDCAQSFHGFCVSNQPPNEYRHLWKCDDCKSCDSCGLSNQVDKMVSCMFCLSSTHFQCCKPKLKGVPNGSYRCLDCAQCVRCGQKTSHRWHDNHTLCDRCKKRGLAELAARHAGQVCPICDSEYFDETPNMICCDKCEVWVHAVCVNLEHDDVTAMENTDLAFHCNKCEKTGKRFKKQNDKLRNYLREQRAPKNVKQYLPKVTLKYTPDSDVGTIRTIVRDTEAKMKTADKTAAGETKADTLIQARRSNNQKHQKPGGNSKISNPFSHETIPVVQSSICTQPQIVSPPEIVVKSVDTGNTSVKDTKTMNSLTVSGWRSKSKPSKNSAFETTWTGCGPHAFQIFVHDLWRLYPQFRHVRFQYAAVDEWLALGSKERKLYAVASKSLKRAIKKHVASPDMVKNKITCVNGIPENAHHVPYNSAHQPRGQGQKCGGQINNERTFRLSEYIVKREHGEMSPTPSPVESASTGKGEKRKALAGSTKRKPFRHTPVKKQRISKAESITTIATSVASPTRPPSPALDGMSSFESASQKGTRETVNTPTLARLPLQVDGASDNIDYDNEYERRVGGAREHVYGHEVGDNTYTHGPFSESCNFNPTVIDGEIPKVYPSHLTNIAGATLGGRVDEVTNRTTYCSNTTLIHTNDAKLEQFVDEKRCKTKCSPKPNKSISAPAVLYDDASGSCTSHKIEPKHMSRAAGFKPIGSLWVPKQVSHQYARSHSSRPIHLDHSRTVKSNQFGWSHSASASEQTTNYIATNTLSQGSTCKKQQRLIAHEYRSACAHEEDYNAGQSFRLQSSNHESMYKHMGQNYIRYEHVPRHTPTPPLPYCTVDKDKEHVAQLLQYKQPKYSKSPMSMQNAIPITWTTASKSTSSKTPPVSSEQYYDIKTSTHSSSMPKYGDHYVVAEEAAARGWPSTHANATGTQTFSTHVVARVPVGDCEAKDVSVEVPPSVGWRQEYTRGDSDELVKERQLEYNNEQEYVRASHQSQLRTQQLEHYLWHKNSRNGYSTSWNKFHGNNTKTPHINTPPADTTVRPLGEHMNMNDVDGGCNLGLLLAAASRMEGREAGQQDNTSENATVSSSRAISTTLVSAAGNAQYDGKNIAYGFPSSGEHTYTSQKAMSVSRRNNATFKSNGYEPKLAANTIHTTQTTDGRTIKKVNSVDTKNMVIKDMATAKHKCGTASRKLSWDKNNCQADKHNPENSRQTTPMIMTTNKSTTEENYPLQNVPLQCIGVPLTEKQSEKRELLALLPSIYTPSNAISVPENKRKLAVCELLLSSPLVMSIERKEAKTPNGIAHFLYLSVSPLVHRLRSSRAFLVVEQCVRQSNSDRVGNWVRACLAKSSTKSKMLNRVKINARVRKIPLYIPDSNRDAQYQFRVVLYVNTKEMMSTDENTSRVRDKTSINNSTFDNSISCMTGEDGAALDIVRIAISTPSEPCCLRKLLVKLYGKKESDLEREETKLKSISAVETPTHHIKLSLTLSTKRSERSDSEDARGKSSHMQNQQQATQLQTNTGTPALLSKYAPKRLKMRMSAPAWPATSDACVKSELEMGSNIFEVEPEVESENDLLSMCDKTSSCTKVSPIDGETIEKIRFQTDEHAISDRSPVLTKTTKSRLHRVVWSDVSVVGRNTSASTLKYNTHTREYQCQFCQLPCQGPGTTSKFSIDKLGKQLCTRRFNVAGGDSGPGYQYGRMLYWGVDEFVHARCAYFSSDEQDKRFLHCGRGKVLFRCVMCDKKGAAIGCAFPRCNEKYHYPCAMTSGCKFTPAGTLYCPVHTDTAALLMFNPDTYDDNIEQRSIAWKRNRGWFVHTSERLALQDVCYAMLTRYEALGTTDLNDYEKFGTLHIKVRDSTLLTVHMGRVNPNPSFHTTKYIYPVGYYAVRTFWSINNPNARIAYHCEISSCGTYPIFVITSSEGLRVVRRSALAAVRVVLRRIETAREYNHVHTSVHSESSSTCSGKHSKLRRPPLLHVRAQSGCYAHWFFGLTATHTVRRLERMIGSWRCDGYRFRTSPTPSGRPARQDEDLEKTAARKYSLKRYSLSGCARSDVYVKRNLKKGDNLKKYAFKFDIPPELSPAKTSSSRQRVLFNAHETYTKERRRAGDPIEKQYHQLKDLVRKRTRVGRSRIQGQGLFATQPIEAGDMVIEYAGEAIRFHLTDQRERYYNSRKIGCYMFRMNDDIVVDATMKGNAARFINHSCEVSIQFDDMTMIRFIDLLQ
eukprot:CFRG2688T1